MATPDCLDAETLAAWIDGGLKGAALERAHAHVADCARCQSLIGAMARMEPAPVVAEVPAWRRWAIWLVPATAAATAFVIWVAVPTEAPVRAPVSTMADQVAVAAPSPQN